MLGLEVSRGFYEVDIHGELEIGILSGTVRYFWLPGIV
jgi:hypothetical protein